MKTLLSLILLLVASPLVLAQATYDTSVASGFNFGVTTITTPSFTIGAGANRAAIVALNMNANSATGITVSVGGVNGTLISGTDSGTTSTPRTLLFCVTNPPSGSRTATASWTGSLNANLGVITATGVDQTNSCNHGTFTAFNVAPTAATSLTVAAFPGDLTTTSAYTFDQWLGTNQTLRWGLVSNVAGGDTGPGTGTTTHTWTDNFAGQQVAISGASFQKVRTSPAINHKAPITY